MVGERLVGWMNFQFLVDDCVNRLAVLVKVKGFFYTTLLLLYQAAVRTRGGGPNIPTSITILFLIEEEAERLCFDDQHVFKSIHLQFLDTRLIAFLTSQHYKI